ncbi:MAG: AAA family ATPase [Thermoleophilia bacterium]
MLGRDPDLAAAAAVLDAARDQRGGALVIRGEGGVGKTALLAAVEETAGDMTVLRAVGVESEAELPFASLHQILAPGLDRLGDLPAPQAAALRGAFGLSAEGADDRFLISLGALGLLAGMADERPLLLVVDDAQWLDRPSAEALGFIARRLAAEPIAALIAAREGEARRFEGPGLPDRRLGGLDRPAARALLEERVGRGLAPHVAERLVSLTGGNALALVELPVLLDEAQLAGRAPLPDHLPLTGRLERAFVDRARDLGDGARAVLAVAVAEDTGDLGVVLAAAARMGATRSDLDEAERSGLVRVTGTRLELRHPMARSALHRGLSFALRQEAHAALAATLEGADDADRRAWHRAAASMAADEEIAAELERTAARARARSGHAAAAAALERAARLSADDPSRARRLVAAAESAWQAGRAPLAQALADEAESRGAGEDVRTRILSVRAAIAVVRGRPSDAHALLMEAAGGTADPAESGDLLLRAGEAAAMAGDAAGLAAADDRARGLPDDVIPEARSWLSGVRLAVEGRMEDAVGPLRVAAQVDDGGDPRTLVWSANADTWLGDHDRTLLRQSRAIDAARARGAFATLAMALTRRGALLAWLGRVNDAWADGDEALRLTEEAGLENSAGQARAVLAVVSALRGEDDLCQSYAERALAVAARGGVVPIIETVTYALGELEIGRGEYEAAFSRLAAVAADPAAETLSPLTTYALVPPLALAAGRAGHPAEGGRAVDRLERWGAATGALWVRPLLLRCRGLLADGEEAIALLEHSLATLGWGMAAPGADARTRLALGESLRRAGRRSDARVHLRSAGTTFASLGATLWEERARDELRATGESIRRRDAAGADSLTPQERRIARFVSEGASNKEVASHLFLSPKTVEYHLGKVFQKLGVGSRSDLVALGTEAFA